MFFTFLHSHSLLLGHSSRFFSTTYIQDSRTGDPGDKMACPKYEYMYLFNTYRLQNYVKVVYQTKRKKFTHTFIISLWKIKGRKFHYQLLRVKKKKAKI